MFGKRIAFGIAMCALLPFDASAQQRSCPPAFGTMERAREALVRFRDRQDIGDASRIAMLAQNIVAPVECPYLRDDQNPAVVVDELIRFVASDGDPHISIEFFGGLAWGFRSDYRTPGLAIPLPMLVWALEEGATSHARGMALSALFRLADDPAVQARLIAWARAPTGPARFPDLPERIMSTVFPPPTLPSQIAGRTEIVALLDAAPQLISNERARCLYEQRGRVPHLLPRDPARPHC